MLPVLIALGVFVLSYWCLGTFAVLRRPGRPRTVRWALAAFLTLWTIGFISLGK